MDQALLNLYHKHIGAAFDRQNRLWELLEKEGDGREWNYTISQATLTFGDALQFLALDLGSWAEPDDSWLWSWCHAKLNLTSMNREMGEAVRQLGTKLSVPAFAASGQFSCGKVLGPDLAPVAAHVFGAILAGELGFEAYYVMPFANGQTVALIRDPRLQVETPDPVTQVLLNFPRVISDYPVPDQRAALVSYADHLGLGAEEAPPCVRLSHNGRHALTARFNTQSRLTELHGEISPRG